MSERAMSSRYTPMGGLRRTMRQQEDEIGIMGALCPVLVHFPGDEVP